MRKLILIAALPLALGACTTYGSPYGYGADPVTSAVGVLGSVLGSQGGYGSPYGYNNNAYGYGGGGLSQAAVNACGNYASRYGPVSVRNAQQTSRSKVHVYGYAGGRDFDCSFRSDLRISDFDI